MALTLDIVSQVTAAYSPQVAGARWAPLGSAGGFSGARLFRGESTDCTYCLKAHSPGADRVRLEAIHRWMAVARAADLPFVPTVVPTRFGRTTVELGDRVWDVTEWMPGRADFRDNPSERRLSAAITAVARMHEAWSPWQLAAPCPAILRRRRALHEWDELLRSGWQPRFPRADPMREDVEAAWRLLPAAIAHVSGPLTYWETLPVPVQPCLCDIWHDHVFFECDQVTAVIDFAAAKIDHVAVDLARLLGSLIPNDPDRTSAALRAYESVRRLANPELVSVLDRSGTIVAVTNWLRWLYHDRREFADRAAVATRFAGLVQRLKWISA